MLAGGRLVTYTHTQSDYCKAHACRALIKQLPGYALHYSKSIRRGKESVVLRSVVLRIAACKVKRTLKSAKVKLRNTAQNIPAR